MLRGFLRVWPGCIKDMASSQPYKTISNILVHSKDKVSKEDTAECVYRISCKNCQKVHIGET